jgi:hypothetical protein
MCKRELTHVLQGKSYKYPDLSIPTILSIAKLIKKWHATGRVLDKTCYDKKTVLRDEKLKDILSQLLVSS